MLIADESELHPYGRVPAGLATAHPGGSAVPRVLVLTALSFEEAREAARDGVDDFVAEPPAPASLAARERRPLDAHARAATAGGRRGGCVSTAA
jgi:hypothetical protein